MRTPTCNLSRLDVAGDLKWDGVMNIVDVQPFTFAITGPAGYQQAT